MRKILIALLLGIFGLVAWTSRPIVNDNNNVGIIRYERLLGRILKVEIDSDRDGRPDTVTKYRWPDAQDGTLYTYSGPYCDDPGHHSEDRDGDGRWDTWYYSLSEAGEGNCVYLFEADTTGDGKPDWKLESDETANTLAKLAELRGF